MKPTYFLFLAVSAFWGARAYAIDSGGSSMNCESAGDPKVSLVFTRSWDNIENGDDVTDLALDAAPAKMRFTGNDLPLGLTARVNLDALEEEKQISMAYRTAGYDVVLVLSLRDLHRDSYEGSPGNDHAAFSFPAKINVLVKDKRLGKSSSTNVKCKAETWRSGMAG